MTAETAGRESSAAHKPHVVALVDYLTGGAERYARLVTMHLDGERYRRTLCVTRTVPDPSEEAQARAELEASGVELLMLGRRSRIDVQPWARLARFVREERVDILHAHKFGSNVWASLLRGLGPVPVMIAHEHTWSYEGRPLRRLLDRELIARRCDRFLAVSQLDRKRMIEIEHIDPDRIEVVPAGIPEPARTGADVRAELGIAADAPVLVSVAHLRPQKAFPVLVGAAADLRQRYPALRVLIVGDGGERARLEALIESQGLADTVTLLGHRRDVTDVLGAANVAVCCSDYEGTPLAVLEYMAAGKAVVATNVGGVPDIVQDGVTGLLVPPRSPADLAARVDELLGESDRAARMGAEGRQLQRAQFTISAMVSHLERIYDELLVTSRGTRRRPRWSSEAVRRANANP